MALIGGISVGPIDVPGLGIYVASAIFIFAFMIVIGRENPLKALGVAVAVPVALFLMFENGSSCPCRRVRSRPGSASEDARQSVRPR